MAGTTGAMASPNTPARPRSRRAVVLLVIIFVVTATLFQTVRVCDQQLTGAGKVVETCRHLQAADPPVLVSAVLLLLVATLLFDLNEVAMLGVSMKRNVADAKAAAESAQDAALSAERALSGAQESAKSAALSLEGAEAAGLRVTEAADAARSAENHARGAEASAAKLEELVRISVNRVPERKSTPPGVDVEREARKLASKYNDIRAEKRSGSERTEEMTGVVSEMISLFAANRNSQALDAAAWLGDQDRGIRLASYVFLHTLPDVALIDPLAHSALRRDNRPFDQYWALRALRRHAEIAGNLNHNDRRALQGLLDSVGPATDRGHEIGEILRLTADGHSREQS